MEIFQPQNLPSYSVVIPTYNRASVLLRALESVMLQTHLPREIIVVDDASTDNTRQLLSSFTLTCKLPVHRLFLERNSGVSAARNLGIKSCTTPWVAFLDSDDEWLPQKMAWQMALVEASHSPVLIHGNEKWLRHGQHLNQMKKHQKSGGRIFTQCLPLCVISPSASVVRRDILDHEPFDEDFIVCEDYDLWLRLTSQYNVGFVEEPILIKHGGHADQLSHQHVAMDYWRIKALAKHLHSSFLSAVERQALVSTGIKKCNILLKGYQKHNNMQNFAEVQSWLNQFLLAKESL